MLAKIMRDLWYHRLSQRYIKMVFIAIANLFLLRANSLKRIPPFLMVFHCRFNHQKCKHQPWMTLLLISTWMLWGISNVPVQHNHVFSWCDSKIRMYNCISTTIWPCVVCESPSPPMGEPDCCDIILEKPCILGAQPTGNMQISCVTIATDMWKSE